MTPAQQLTALINKYDPKIAAFARKWLPLSLFDRILLTQFRAP